MAKVSIRVNSEVEEHGVLLQDILQITAEATEGFCSQLHGYQDKINEQYKKIVLAHAQFIGIVAEIRFESL